MSEDLKIITGLAGPHKGKRLKVKKTTISIGSNRKCDITLKGEYVSDLHAVIKKREDGVWVVQNNSVNGTLINGERADLKVLVEGDRVQIGADSMFEVSFETGRKKKPEESGAVETGSNLKQTVIIAAISVYLLLMAGVIMFLSSRDEATAVTAVHHGDVAVVVKETRGFLLSDSGTAPTSDSLKMPNVNRAMSMEFYMLRSLVNSNGPDNEIDELTDQISAKIEQHLFLTWQYEQRQQLEPAIGELEKVFSAVPDIRSPSAAYALQKISEIRARISNE